MPRRILVVGRILDPDRGGGDGFRIRKALRRPVRKGVRKKSRYLEVLLPIGGACETEGAANVAASSPDPAVVRTRP